MDIVVRSRTSSRRVRHVRQRTINGRFARVLPRMRPGRYTVSVTYQAKPGSVAQAARSFAVPR